MNMLKFVYVQAYYVKEDLSFRHTVVEAVDLEDAYDRGYVKLGSIEGMVNDYAFQLEELS